MDAKQSENIATARLRSEVYALLGLVFQQEPDADLLRMLERPAVAEVIEKLSGTNSFTVPLNSADALEELACEYTRLFVGPGPHIGPYESLFRDDQSGRHWGTAAAEVKRFLAHHGIAYASTFHGFPDHLSVEFHFMSLLTHAEAEAIEIDDRETAVQAIKIQNAFFNDHIRQWVAAFCGQVIEDAELEFYRNAARATRQWCAWEEAFFDDEDPSAAPDRGGKKYVQK